MSHGDMRYIHNSATESRSTISFSWLRQKSLCSGNVERKQRNPNASSRNSESSRAKIYYATVTAHVRVM